MKKQLLLILSILAFFSVKLMAQDPEFTQFYANPIYLNPAFTGSERCPRMVLNYRNQWPKLNQAYVTYAATYDQYVHAVEGGLGLVLLNDVQASGAINTLSASGIYSYQIPVNKNFSLNMGFQATFIQKNLSNNFIYPDMIDPMYGPIYNTNEKNVLTTFKKNLFDFSAGVLEFTKSNYFGIAVHHLTQPSETWRDNDDAILPRKLTIHYGTTIPLNVAGYKKGELTISPNFLFQQQRDFQQFNYGLYLSRRNIVAGVWMRQNFKFSYDSFMMLVGYIQKKIKIAYSYDFTVSRLRNSTLGAHEVSFGYIFRCPQTKQRFSIINCPSF